MLAELAGRQPDNISLDQAGNLWIASHQHNILSQSCVTERLGPCRLPFSIVKVDPDSMQAE
jgi:sugar lactone lactonase YvrE